MTAALFGPQMLADPYPTYHRLRADDPVHWHEPFGAWVLTRYDDVLLGLNDPRFSAERTAKLSEMAHGEGLEPFFRFLSTRMLFADPPRHIRLRRLVSKAFTPHAVAAMRPRIAALVDGFFAATAERDGMDVIADLAYPLPVTVIVEMLGLPAGDREQLKRWSDDFIVYFSKHIGELTPEEFRRAVAAVAAEREYFGAAIERRRGQPGADLLSGLVHAEEDGDQLSVDEIHGAANLLLTAGHETTTNLIGNGTLALLRHPDQLERLRAEPALLPSAIEELLRYDAPVQFTHRLAAEDVPLRGKTIRKGQFVYLVLAAANHDPERFADPDRLDITRKDNHHLAFGQGHHFCLGAPLARLEALIAFERLLRRAPALRLAGGEPQRLETFNLHGLKALPVLF